MNRFILGAGCDNPCKFFWFNQPTFSYLNSTLNDYKSPANAQVPNSANIELDFVILSFVLLVDLIVRATVNIEERAAKASRLFSCSNRIFIEAQYENRVI